MRSFLPLYLTVVVYRTAICLAFCVLSCTNVNEIKSPDISQMAIMFLSLFKS